LWTKVYTAASDIRALYARGHITADEVQQSFIDLGVPAERAETFKNKLVMYVGPERTEKERDLTKTDILRMFKNGIFTEGEATTFLQDIGYSEYETAYLIELYKYQPLINIKELSMSNILKSYRYEIYTRTEAYNALLGGGWSESAAETLLELEIKILNILGIFQRWDELMRLYVESPLQRKKDVQTYWIMFEKKSGEIAKTSLFEFEADEELPVPVLKRSKLTRSQLKFGLDRFTSRKSS
ncbi:unnamed protein product, partial [marine sediment metagenome]